MNRIIPFLVVMLLGLTGCSYFSSAPFDQSAVSSFHDSYIDGRTSFSVSTSDGLRVDYHVFALFALPGESMRLTTSVPVAAVSEDDLSLEVLGEVVSWTAPESPGAYSLTLSAQDGTEMRLHLLVMHPASAITDEMLGDYRIGTYPEEPYQGLETYEPPRGLFEVTDDLTDLPLSPHFTLGQFICKQDADWPRFVFVQARLLVKLERLLEAVNEAGVRTDGFHVMSGYRTPYYNAAIGNGENSRHVFGGAADIFIDVAPEDGVMDDLNGDGTVTAADAEWLAALFEQVLATPEWEDLRGGLAVYPATAAHGPFVHVDERGSPARWSP